jgi:hypothetical protein
MVEAVDNDGITRAYDHEVALDEFDYGMDADAVRETLDIILCQDLDVTDINEEDLYSEAERIYQALKRAEK